MLHDIIFLILGLALIIAGGNFVTDGSVAVAKKFNVSPIVVGLTIVAFGSSTPDLVVSVMSTISGKSGLAIGNVVGADIFDMLLVIGITAMIKPVKFSRTALWCDLPVMMLAALFIFVCANDRLFNHSATDMINRSDGVAMLVILCVFMFFTFSNAKHKAPVPESADHKITKAAAPAKTIKMWLASIMIVGGLGALVVGGNWIVDGASGIAQKAGLSESLIGLTIVAIGSSLPDLATSVTAAIKHQGELALGNVLGSCIIDVLLVLGTCSVIHPLQTAGVTLVDFSTLLGGALFVWILALTKRNHSIGKIGGSILIVSYIAYMAYLCLSA